LDLEEFADRYARCLEAKTYAELDELLADLPLWPGGAAAAGGWDPGRGPGRAWPTGARLFPLAWLVPLAVMTVLVASAAFSGHGFFWPVFPLVFFFVVRPLLWGRGLGRGRWGGRGWGCGHHDQRDYQRA